MPIYCTVEVASYIGSFVGLKKDVLRAVLDSLDSVNLPEETHFKDFKGFAIKLETVGDKSVIIDLFEKIGITGGGSHGSPVGDNPLLPPPPDSNNAPQNNGGPKIDPNTGGSGNDPNNGGPNKDGASHAIVSPHLAELPCSVGEHPSSLASSLFVSAKDYIVSATGLNPSVNVTYGAVQFSDGTPRRELSNISLEKEAAFPATSSGENSTLLNDVTLENSTNLSGKGNTADKGTLDNIASGGPGSLSLGSTGNSTILDDGNDAAKLGGSSKATVASVEIHEINAGIESSHHTIRPTGGADTIATWNNILGDKFGMTFIHRRPGLDTFHLGSSNPGLDTESRFLPTIQEVLSQSDTLKAAATAVDLTSVGNSITAISAVGDTTRFFEESRERGAPAFATLKDFQPSTSHILLNDLKFR